MALKDLPARDRPRERLLREGPSALADYELLAIVLGAGRRGESAIALAQRLLGEGGLDGVRRRGSAGLMRTSGLGPARAAQVAAALELGRRTLDPPVRLRLDEPEQVYDYLRRRLDTQVEELLALLVDGRLSLLGEVRVARGGRGGIGLQPADILRPAVQAGALGVLLAHNHPSGDPTPSPADVQTTRQIAQAAQLLGMQLVDHLVIGDNSFVSLRLQGLLD